MSYQQQVYEQMVRLPIETLCVQFEYLSCFAISQKKQTLRIVGGTMQQYYMGVLTALKERIKEAPLEFLSGLASIPVHFRDPDKVKEICLTVYELASNEIHRRSFQDSLYKPNKKNSLNPMCMGYLRKPSY